MLTLSMKFPVEIEKGVIKEEEQICVAVPTNNFEGSFLKFFILQRLASDFHGYNLQKSIDGKSVKSVPNDIKSFSKFCSSLWYDKWGRFFFDPAQSKKFDSMNPNMISFFVASFGYTGSNDFLDFGSECKHIVENNDDNKEEDTEKNYRNEELEKITFDFTVYAHEGGVLFNPYWLFPKILKMAKKVSVKKQ